MFQLSMNEHIMRIMELKKYNNIASSIVSRYMTLPNYVETMSLLNVKSNSSMEMLLA